VAERGDIDTRFKPGQSGNLKGRPKGSKSLSTRLKEYLDGARIGEEKLKRKQVADEVIENLVKKATGRKSDASLHAIDMVFDRTEGKVPQGVQVQSVTMETVAEMQETDEHCDSPNAGEPSPEVQERPESVQ
jgi:hypothetical protein